MAPLLDLQLVPETVLPMAEGLVPQLLGQELEPLLLERERVPLLVPVLLELGLGWELEPLWLERVLVPVLLELGSAQVWVPLRVP